MEYSKNVDQINAKISETAREIEELPAHYKEHTLTSPIKWQHLENGLCDTNNNLISKSLLCEKY